MKIRFILLTFLLIFIGTKNILASNSIDGFTLTLTQATNRAIQTNADMNTMRENLNSVTNRRNNMMSSSMFFNSLSEVLDSQIALMNLTNERNSITQNMDSLRDTLGFLVASYFSDIVIATNELTIYDQNILFIEREINVLRNMLNVGMASRIEYDMANLNLNSIRHNRTTLVNEINEAHINLNRLIGTPTDRVHNLIFDIPFEKLNVVNFTGHLNHQTRNHFTVLQAEAAENIHRFRLNNYVTPIDQVTGLAIPGAVTSTELIATLNQASREVINARRRVEEHITETYHNIMELERDIDSLYITLEDFIRQSEILNAKFEVGEILNIDIQKNNLEISKIQNDIETLKIRHGLLVMQFLNPNISVM
ncbi:MAG: TolC family protein [Defluviitaleaceae bacterium]|nr:TolC family protein [Defluviitaleaceae bacterium]